MIDKRVKKAAPRRGKPKSAPAPGARPDRAAGESTQEKPRRIARPTGTKSAAPKSAKPSLQRQPKPRKQDARPPRDEDAGMRIAKVMARAGLCSRRDAESWIEQGRVFLNGKVLTTPAINVGPQDQVSVDGVALAPRERTRLFLFHKPRGLVTTDKDPEGRQTIFDYLHQNWPDGPRVISIGRLDINTEGLLLLTNDGGLARVLELPSTGWMRRYRVRANGKTDQAVLDRLRDGVSVDGVDYAGIDATLDRVQGDNVWMSLGLREGKNREIKRVLEHIGLYVNRLIRISYGPFQLGELAEGKLEEVRTRVLRDQLGPALANEADADFESPLAEPQKEESSPPRGRVRPREAGKDDRGARGRGDAREAPRPRGRDHKPSPIRGAPLRGDRRMAPTEKREASAPVEPSFKPRGPRKHISAMRATNATSEKGDRKKSFLSETADRKGRTVTVERVAKANPRRRQEEPARVKDDARKPRGTGRVKMDNAERVTGKVRAGGKPSTRQNATRPADGKGPRRKPSSEAAKPTAARPQASYPKGTYPKGAQPKGAQPKADSPKGRARPARPGGRPHKPR